ncbi:MAG: hypothetical protein WC222_02565 [Parachlamydiales bacterium]|jgi:hypothetical protein
MPSISCLPLSTIQYIHAKTYYLQVNLSKLFQFVKDKFFNFFYSIHGSYTAAFLLCKEINSETLQYTARIIDYAPSFLRNKLSLRILDKLKNAQDSSDFYQTNKVAINSIYPHIKAAAAQDPSREEALQRINALAYDERVTNQIADLQTKPELNHLNNHLTLVPRDIIGAVLESLPDQAFQQIEFSDYQLSRLPAQALAVAFSRKLNTSFSTDFIYNKISLALTSLIDFSDFKTTLNPCLETIKDDTYKMWALYQYLYLEDVSEEPSDFYSSSVRDCFNDYCSDNASKSPACQLFAELFKYENSDKNTKDVESLFLETSNAFKDHEIPLNSIKMWSDMDILLCLTEDRYTSALQHCLLDEQHDLEIDLEEVKNKPINDKQKVWDKSDLQDNYQLLLSLRKLDKPVRDRVQNHLQYIVTLYNASAEKYGLPLKNTSVIPLGSQ